jgi:hypothetical protein
MTNQDIEIPSFVFSDVDKKIAEEQKIIDDATKRIGNLQNLRVFAIDRYITDEKKRQETERLLELGRQYDSILKGETNA